MSTYRVPSSSTRVTSSWQDHKDRNPPSTQPGTDYGVNWGSPLYAVGDGKVTGIKTTNAGDGEGRTITILLDDGNRETRSLHLQEVHVSVGERVTRGQKIGKTGASGYGSDYYYGAHVHQTLWPHGAWDNPTVDFEKYVGEEPAPEPPPPDDGDEEDEMGMKGAHYTRSSDGARVNILFNEVSGFWSEHTGGSGDYNPEIAENWNTGSWPKLTEAHVNALKRNLDAVRNAGNPGATTAAMVPDE